MTSLQPRQIPYSRRASRSKVDRELTYEPLKPPFDRDDVTGAQSAGLRATSKVTLTKPSSFSAMRLAFRVSFSPSSIAIVKYLA